MNPPLRVSDVSKRFGYRWVLRNVSMEVQPGEAVLLVGGNGAGKTTLLRVMAGLLKPNRGRIERTGAVGMVAHHTMMYDALTARENLAFFARLHGLPKDGREDRLLELLGLAEFAGERIVTFSRGMLQRLAIARSLMHEPDVMLFDEPLTGLDDAASHIVLNAIAELEARRAALVIATHQLVELVGVAARVGFMVQGELVALEPIAGRDAGGVVSRYRELVAANGG
ncbi:MAG: ABC transporter ATP-binding protein [Gemmatimonadota bacterium]